MKKPAIRLLLPIVAILLLAGCRVRVVGDPALADENLRRLSAEVPPTDAAAPTEPSTEAPEETRTTAESTEAPTESTEPPTTEPEPETTETPTETTPPATPPPTEPEPPTTEPPVTTAPPETEPEPPVTTAPVETEPPEPTLPMQTEPAAPEPTDPLAPESPPQSQEPEQPGPTENLPDDTGSGGVPGGETTDDPDAPPVPEIPEVEETGGAGALEERPSLGITVTFDPNGGESGVMTTVVRTGEPYGVLPGAQWRGRLFDGWWTDPEAGSRITAGTMVTAEEDHVLYAHWSEPQGFIVTFDGNGGRVKSRDAKLQLLPGNPIGSLPTPIREGYDFLGWWTEPENGAQVTPETVFETETDRTLYAHWQYNAAAFWSFTLTNKTQQIYLCQQIPIYLEVEDHLTQIQCGLITDTGSYNVAAYLETPETTDDWVAAKNPSVILRCVSSMAEAETARAAMQQRFPEKTVYIVQTEALGSGPLGLYARLALAKRLYPDWYVDVDLERAARELGVTMQPIS